MRFKIGDEVVIVRLTDRIPYDSEQIEKYSKHFGKTAKITEIGGNFRGKGFYVLDMPYDSSWEDDEVELSKNYIITQILNDL